MAGSAGSFAGGFAQTFIQAQQLKLERMMYMSRMGLDPTTGKQKVNPAQAAFNQGVNAASAREAGGGGGQSGGATGKSQPYKGQLSAADRDAMIRTVYGEAAGEGPQGQAAVAHVILNRAQDSRWGKDGVQGVVYAPKQFSTWNPGDPAGKGASALNENDPQYKAVANIVDGAASGKIPDPTNGATNFYNPQGGYGAKAGYPAGWDQNLTNQNDVTIGNHRFVGQANYDLNPSAAQPVAGNTPQSNAIPVSYNPSDPPLPPSRPQDTQQAIPVASNPQPNEAYASGGPVNPTTGNPLYASVDGMPANPTTGAQLYSQASSFADGGPVEDEPFLLPGTGDEVDSNGAPVGQIPLPSAIPAQPTNETQPQAGDDETLDYSDPNSPSREGMETAAYGPGYAENRMQTAARRAGMTRMPSPMGRSGGARGGGAGIRMPYAGGGGGDGGGIQPVGFDTPEVSDENGNLATMAVQAIQGGLHAIGHMLGIGGAISDDPMAPQKMKSFMQGDGRLSDEDYKGVLSAVDPSDNLPTAMKNIAGLESMYRYYLQSGDPARANMTAAAMLQTSTYAARKYGSDAMNLLHKGNVQGALDSLSSGYDMIPDGRTATATANEDGSAVLTQKDMNGNVVSQQPVSGQEIWQAAVGLKDGTAAWKMIEAAAGGGGAKGGQAPISPNLAQGLAMLNGQNPTQAAQGQPPASTPGSNPTAPAQPQPQGTPAAAQAPAPTAGSNPAPDQALPVQPASLGAQPQQPAQAVPTGTGDLTQFSQLQAQARAQMGWQPRPPANLTNPQWQPQTAQEQQLFQQVQKAKLAEWNAENNKRGAMADEYVKNRVLQDRQGQTQIAINDRQQAGETARMNAQAGLETQRDRDTAERAEYTPLKPDDRSLAPEGTDATTQAQSVTPKAFFPDQAPDAAVSQFNQHFGQFGTQTANNVRDAVLMTARQSKLPMDSSAMAVRDIVLPSAQSANQLPFNMERVGPNKDIAHVSFTDGRDALMPMGTYTMLMKVRTAQVGMMGKTQAAQDQRAATQKDLDTRSQNYVRDRLNQADQVPGIGIGVPEQPPGSSALPVH